MTGFVAIGDSFTEGVGDPLPDGTFRGWADLVAAELCSPGFGYANLAVRGRRFDDVVTRQVEAAIAMGPSLVSISGGGNDALWRGFDLAAMRDRLDQVVARLRASGADVLLFRFPDMSVRLPLPRVLRPRIVAMNDLVTEVAERRGVYLVDLFGDRALDGHELWSADRLHLNPLGHRRVADQVLATLGRAAPPPPPPGPPGTGPAPLADLRWASAYLAPWLRRRLTGRSSGDGILPKHPVMTSVFESPSGPPPDRRPG
ncbi:SGNH/GDSL hydrolase family protein [Streptosporangium sp. NBC_01495]|uniref:SGNH/GDSL hydrolase family protein n=1 Tax=Streptosporangium sp. NBC_01495 TaxID=2903899 RepID=UPI002E2F780F|nr:SGNH/GDSL hydrolase family protein [Streptosporangium sp. NBC_01495]